MKALNSWIWTRNSWISTRNSWIWTRNSRSTNFTLTSCKQLRGQSTSVVIGLIKLSRPFDTVNYKLCFKHCILQKILHVFWLFTFVWNKIFCSENWAVFWIFLWIWFVLAVGFTVLKILRFWYPFCKVVGNEGFISYSR